MSLGCGQFDFIGTVFEHMVCITARLKVITVLYAWNHAATSYTHYTCSMCV